jgi:hypothetical protein
VTTRERVTDPAARPRPRVLVVTDSDSYVKYGAALAGRLPKDWGALRVVARSSALPSPRQLADALEGTRFEDDVVPVVGLGDLTRLLDEWRPDVVLLAARGYTVQAAVSVVENGPDRPVLVSGLAGIAVPVLPYGLGFRRSVDVFVVHSRRELREFAIASRRLSVPLGFELATMPFVDRAPVAAGADAMRAPQQEEPRDRIVFAAQAQVPSGRRDRAHLLDRLVETARAHSPLQVVVKVRAQEGEAQTHHEQVSYPDLLAERSDVPPNLVVEAGSMRAQLRRAVGLVTVSSTAVLEAIAADVPVIALTDYGVGAAQINVVLKGSGLLAGSDELVAGRFRRADEAWLQDNYFHDPDQDTWVPRVEELLEQRETLGLLPYREAPASWMNRLRRLMYRHFAFAPEDPGLVRELERRFLVVAQWVNRRRWHLTRLLRRLGVVR